MNARSKYFFYFKINLGKTKFLFNVIETYILSVKSFRSYSLIFFQLIVAMYETNYIFHYPKNHKNRNFAGTVGNFKPCFMVALTKYLQVQQRWDFYEMIKCFVSTESLIIVPKKPNSNLHKFSSSKYCYKLELTQEAVSVSLQVVYGYCSGGKHRSSATIPACLYHVYKSYKLYRFTVSFPLL